MPPTIRLSKFASDAPDEIEAYTSRLWGSDTHWEGGLNGDRANAHFLNCGLGQVTISVAHLQNYSVSRRLETTTRIVIPLVGGLQRTWRGREASYGDRSARALVTEMGEPVTYRVKNGTGLIVSVPQAMLVARASVLIDSPAQLQSPVDPEIDLRAPHALGLQATISQALNECQRFSALGLPLTSLSAYEFLVADLLACAILPEVRSVMAAEPLDAGASRVRTACEYIEASSDRSIDFSALAHRLGVSPRALQKGFHKVVGMSPREFLLTCRLNRARSKLCSPACLAVKTAALDSGFLDLSFFTTKYREMFGELPSETLHRHKTQSAPRPEPVRIVPSQFASNIVERLDCNSSSSDS